MNLEQRRKIRNFAETVRTALALGVPVNVEEAVERLDGRIVRPEAMPDASEALVRALPDDDEDRFEIAIASHIADNRYRFSVAHEIAHLFLHMGFLTDKWKSEPEYVDAVMFRFGYSAEEAEAHEFAGTLLMPEEAFREKVDQLKINGKVKLEPLAQHFGVSKDAARIRGRYLGLFDWE